MKKQPKPKAPQKITKARMKQNAISFAMYISEQNSKSNALKQFEKVLLTKLYKQYEKANQNPTAAKSE